MGVVGAESLCAVASCTGGRSNRSFTTSRFCERSSFSSYSFARGGHAKGACPNRTSLGWSIAGGRWSLQLQCHWLASCNDLGDSYFGKRRSDGCSIARVQLPSNLCASADAVYAFWFGSKGSHRRPECCAAMVSRCRMAAIAGRSSRDGRTHRRFRAWRPRPSTTSHLADLATRSSVEIGHVSRLRCA